MIPIFLMFDGDDGYSRTHRSPLSDATLHQRELASGINDSPQVSPGRNKTGVPLQLGRVTST